MTRTPRGRRGTDGAANRVRQPESPAGRPPAAADRRPADNRPTTPNADRKGRADRKSAADEKRTPDTKPAKGNTRTPNTRPGNTSIWQRFLHDRSVRARIAALVLLPLLATLVLGALNVKSALDDANAAAKVQDLASVGVEATDAFHKIQDERDITILRDAGGEHNQGISDARAATDDAVATLQSAADGLTVGDYGPEVADAISTFERDIERLDGYRDQHDSRAPLTDVSLPDNYNQVAQSVRGLVVAASSVVDDPESAQLIRALNDITQASESASMERGQFAYFIVKGEAVGADQQELASTLQAEQQLLIANFLSGIADPATLNQYSDRLSDANRKITAERRDINNQSEARGTNEQWYANSTSRLEIMRETSTAIADQVVADAEETTNDARLIAGISAAVVLLILVATALLTLLVARSIIGPLRRLRVAALNTAKTNLPALVDRIQQDGPAATRPGDVAVRAEGRDEIGQVATAFNEVHATAVRVAGEQALLRQNLDTIVVNLSRRTQSLVDRQLGEIEGLESRERDPDQLSTLFRIDHIATRVRRHAESLLVLAGVEEMRKQSSASAILDVVRAAVGEVEQYPRVEFGVMPTDLVSAAAVDDVAHLLAELIDNATEFSAPSTPVTLTSQPLLGGGLRIQVADSGLGVPADQLAELNSRLNSPGDIDVAASRTLGLYVVARLAAKHGIQVRLEPGVNAGTIAQVDLPQSLILSPLDTTEGVIPPVTEASTPPSADPATPATPRTLQADAPQNGALLPAERPRPVVEGHPQRTPQRPATPAPASQNTGLPKRPKRGQPPAQDTPPMRPATPATPTPATPARTGFQGRTEDVRDKDTGPVRVPSDSLWASSTPDAAPSNGRSREATPSHGETTPAGPSDRAPDSLRAPQPELRNGDTPVYDAVRSAWFSKGEMPANWKSPADEGWRRAADALRAAEEAATARRQQQPSSNTPNAGSTPVGPTGAAPAGPPPRPPRLDRGLRSTPQSGGRPAPDRPQPPAGEPPQRTRHTEQTPTEAERPAQPATASWTSGGTPGPAANEPVLNASGLPVRRKGASLIPGSIDAAAAAGQQEEETPGSDDAQDAGNVASTLSSLQRGVSRGREETGGWVPKRPGGPERSTS